jgi:hypothetical protein
MPGQVSTTPRSNGLSVTQCAQRAAGCSRGAPRWGSGHRGPGSQRWAAADGRELVQLPKRLVPRHGAEHEQQPFTGWTGLSITLSACLATAAARLPKSIAIRSRR